VTATPKRRWYQFSLKTLLVVLTLASVSLGWLTYERNEVQKREVAIARIKELGGRVYFDEEKPFRPIWIVPLFGHRAFYEVRAVDLDETKVTDADLVHLTGLTKLDLLRLSHTQITDAGLVHLTGLSSLKTLSLSYTQVTDAGLVHLVGLKELKELVLVSTRVTDEGIGRLKATLPNVLTIP
jgi:hypothetical protein